MQWNGKTQGVLLMGYGGVLFYNEQKLKDAKLGAPKNADEWLAAMKATTDAGKGQFGLATITAEHPNMVVEMASWVIGSGADWLKGGKYNFTDPAVVKAVDNWRQSIAYAPKGTNSATARQLFIDGKVDVPARRPVGVGRAREVAGRRAAEPEDRRAAVPGDAGRREQLAASRGEDRREEEGGRVELHPDGRVARVAEQVRADRIAGAAQGRAHGRPTWRRIRISR